MKHWLLLVASVCLTTQAGAHHAMDLADAEPVEVQGQILISSWDGAHVVYRLRSTNEQGEVVTWEVMGASPKILRARGISKQLFPIGETIIVRGRFDPHTKFIAPDVFITAVGRQFEMGFYPPTMKRERADSR